MLLLEGSGGGAGAMGINGEPEFDEHDDECADNEVDELDDGRLIRFEPPFDGWAPNDRVLLTTRDFTGVVGAELCLLGSMDGRQKQIDYCLTV